MHVNFEASGADTLISLRRLWQARWGFIAGWLVLLIGAPPLIGIAPPILPMLGLLAVLATITALSHLNALQQRYASAGDLQMQLLIDLLTLGGLVFFSGGVTNPLIALLLPPVAYAALTLPAARAASIAVIAVALYIALLFFYLPLPVSDVSRATQLHLIGMALSFALSALLIAWFVIRMTSAIRHRDAELAAAREQALRDERVLAVGTLAAGAAHELGSPLGTMALLTGELAHEKSLSDEARDDIEVLRQQIAHCKTIITRLSAQAQIERLEALPRLAVDAWLSRETEHWQSLRPGLSLRIHLPATTTPPEILADPRLTQALHNLLDNAARAGGKAPIEISLDWQVDRVTLSITDQGPGFPNSILASGGQTPQTAHAGGQGIGLMLTRTAIEQLGGSLSLNNLPEGGARASLHFPTVRDAT